MCACTWRPTPSVCIARARFHGCCSGISLSFLLGSPCWLAACDTARTGHPGTHGASGSRCSGFCDAFARSAHRRGEAAGLCHMPAASRENSGRLPFGTSGRLCRGTQDGVREVIGGTVVGRFVRWRPVCDSTAAQRTADIDQRECFYNAILQLCAYKSAAVPSARHCAPARPPGADNSPRKLSNAGW